MGLFSTKKRNTQTSEVVDVSSPLNIGGDNEAPVFNLANSSGNRIITSDMGAIKASFDLAGKVADSTQSIADSSFSLAKDGLNLANDGIKKVADGVNSSLAFVGQQLKSDTEKGTNQFTYLVLGLALIGLLGAVAVFGRK